MTLRSWLLGLGTLLAASCGAWPEQDAPPEPSTRSQAVIAGARTPEQLGFPLSAMERNAALAQTVTYQGKTYQGCSATLVGDRVVVSAGHCVVLNQQAWLQSGAAPEVVPASKLAYVVGDDVDHPLCTLSVESVHLHPGAKLNPTTHGIDHDVSVSVLSQSVLETCLPVLPLMLNRDPVPSALLGENALQGGFGSTDGTYNFSKLRFWSLGQINGVDDDYVTVYNQQKGFPTFGDSGSGLLFRYGDRVLRVLGVCSVGDEINMAFWRLDQETAFLDSVLPPGAVCGALAAKPACRDDVLLSCGPAGVQSQDCAASRQHCLPADAGATCGCGCNAGPACEASCDCDPDCPCACDTSSACEASCSCDPDCYRDAGQPADDEPPPARKAPLGCQATGQLAWLAALLGLAPSLLRRRDRV